MYDDAIEELQDELDQIDAPTADDVERIVQRESEGFENTLRTALMERLYAIERNNDR